MRSLPVVTLVLSATAVLVGCKSAAPPPSAKDKARSQAEAEREPRVPLKRVSEFSRIADPAARSAALFVEAGRVLTHPRCSNCHPPDDTPRQGLEQRIHVPPVSGGDSGHGTPGLPCVSCHRATNVATVGATVQSIPGNPKWALAPVEMAWVGKSLGAICAQLKDPQRNGGKSLAEIQHHAAEDVLVGWGWNPGPGLEPVPGSQKQFGELIQAWIDTGAHCPTP